MQFQFSIEDWRSYYRNLLIFPIPTSLSPYCRGPDTDVTTLSCSLQPQFPEALNGNFPILLFISYTYTFTEQNERNELIIHSPILCELRWWGTGTRGCNKGDQGGGSWCSCLSKKARLLPCSSHHI